jgi:hypothetical protein
VDAIEAKAAAEKLRAELEKRAAELAKQLVSS